MNCPNYRCVFEDEVFEEEESLERVDLICAYCNGSGEGQTGRTICWNCEGRGTVQDTIGSL